MNFIKKKINHDYFKTVDLILLVLLYPLWHYGLLIHEYLSLWIECEQLLNL